jgi:chromosome segregation ATPase
MDNTGDIDLLMAFKKLLAESKSKDERLEDYLKIIDSRDNEIEMLHTMLTEANEYRSTLDSQLKELKDLQQYLAGVQQQEARSTYMVTGRQQQPVDSLSIERQFENLQLAYADLQSQLAGLQSQLLDMNNRNLLLQQQASHIAELESLLAIAEGQLEAMNKNDGPAEGELSVKP